MRKMKKIIKCAIAVTLLLYGREGYMLICPDCLTIIGFVPYLLS